MTDAQLDEELIAALRERGQRVTLPRLLVHRHVRRSDRHVTPEQVHAELSPQLPSLSPATIYGTLDLLDALGFVRRVSTQRGGVTYDSRVEDHHHAICRSCGRVQDLDVSLDARAAERAARAAGFHVTHAQLTVSGLCEACAAQPAGIVDAHVHFWDPAERHYDWLAGKPALRRPFGPPDLAPERHRPERLVVVEADCRDEEALDEAAWVAALARDDGRIAGIVANAPLERGPEVLDAVVGRPLVAGVRRQLEPRPAAFALGEAFTASLRRLGALGLPFDACVHRGQIPVVGLLADAAPQTTIVLDHLGKPDVAARAMEPWRADLAALAARPNVVCKLSGLTAEADPARWEHDVVPYLEHALDVFGPARCLAGSDWPVLTQAASYERWFDVLEAVVAPADREAVLSANAGRIYGA